MIGGLAVLLSPISLMGSWLGMGTPLPDMEVSEPSNKGEASKPVWAVTV